MGEIEDQSYSAFISYATPDREKAGEICRSLEGNSFRCWIAPRDVRAGREYGEEIIQGIESSRCLVLVLSEASNESAFVRREVERAVSKRKPVFPVRVEDVMPSPGLELFISTTHWIDAWSGPLAGHAERLAKDLGDESVFNEATRYSAGIVRRRSLPRWLASVAAVLVIAGVVALVNYLTRGEPGKGGGNSAGGGGVPRGIPMGPTPTMAEILAQGIDATGVDPASIKAEDISISAKPDYNDTISIELKQSEAFGKLAIHSDKLFLAIGGNGEFKEVGTGMSGSIGYRSIDQKALAQAKSIQLRYDLRDGRSIGPFTYPFDPNTLISDIRKQEIDERDQWFSAYDGATSISFSPLIGFFNMIKAIRIGSDPEKLDRQIDILPVEDRILNDPHIVFIKQPNHTRAVPIPPGLNELYIELEYTDGTRSTVRKVSLPEQNFASLQLAPEGAQVGDAPPAVYALFGEDVNDKSRENFALLPFAPRGTKRILHSYDSGSLTAFSPLYFINTSLGSRGGNESAPSASTVQFLFQMVDGSEQGPYSYKLDGVYEMPLETYKKKALVLRRELVAAFRIANRSQLEHRASAGGGGNSTLGDLSSTIQRRTLGGLLGSDYKNKEKILGSLPGVFLFPNNPSQPARAFRYWATVAEVYYGTSKDNLDQRAPVNLTPKEVMEDNRLIIRKFVWHATLPPDTKEIYCKFVFHDGDETEPFSVPIEDL